MGKHCIYWFNAKLFPWNHVRSVCPFEIKAVDEMIYLGCEHWEYLGSAILPILSLSFFIRFMRWLDFKVTFKSFNKEVPEGGYWSNFAKILGKYIPMLGHFDKEKKGETFIGWDSFAFVKETKPVKY